MAASFCRKNGCTFHGGKTKPLLAVHLHWKSIYSYIHSGVGIYIVYTIDTVCIHVLRDGFTGGTMNFIVDNVCHTRNGWVRLFLTRSEIWQPTKRFNVYNILCISALRACSMRSQYTHTHILSFDILLALKRILWMYGCDLCARIRPKENHPRYTENCTELVFVY